MYGWRQNVTSSKWPMRRSQACHCRSCRTLTSSVHLLYIVFCTDAWPNGIHSFYKILPAQFFFYESTAWLVTSTRGATWPKIQCLHENPCQIINDKFTHIIIMVWLLWHVVPYVPFHQLHKLILSLYDRFPFQEAAALYTFPAERFWNKKSIKQGSEVHVAKNKPPK